MTDPRSNFLDTAMSHLRSTLPESDLVSYPRALFRQFAEHALMLRAAAPWCRDLDPEIFAHYVLCPRVNDEDLSFHRRLFYNALWPRIRDLPDQESRVLEVNRWCHEIASYAPQDERTASPLTVYRSGVGRCGEESAFLVSALRSVGIPARQVYVPLWSHCDDNHAWVEVLCGDRWRFLGACEPEPVLDRGWFNAAASRAVLVRSRLFGPGLSPLHGEFLSREGAVSFYNQTSRYAAARPRLLRAVHSGVPAAGAIFRIGILNEHGFRPAVSLTADENGEARPALGLGDIHVTALWRGLTAEGICGPEGISLELKEVPANDAGWTRWDFRAPDAAPFPAPLESALRQARARDLREGAELRRRRLASLCPEPESRDPLVRAARGNHRAVSDFLRADPNPLRRELLETLTEKDLRDVTYGTLDDHLRFAPPIEDCPPELYAPYVLCPRVGLERLTPWRGVLANVPGDLTPRELWRELLWRVDTDVPRDSADLIRTPPETWSTGRGDPRSLRTLWVACLRARGIPARLSPLDGGPEFWEKGRFRSPEARETGILILTGDSALLPRRDWTLSRLGSEGWRLLKIPEDPREIGLSEVGEQVPPEDRPAGTRKFVLPAGRYRLITSVRLPGGSQSAASRDLTLAPGETKEAELCRCAYSLRDMMTSVPMTPLPASAPDGTAVPDIFRACPGDPTLVLWIEPGTEPTERLLTDLSRAAWTPEPLLARVILLPSRPFELTFHLPDAAVLTDDWDYDRELIARDLGCDPSQTPLTVLCDGMGRAVYAAAGHSPDLAPLLVRLARAAGTR